MSEESPFVLCVDLDGVVADYEMAFRRIVAEELGIDPASIGPQRTWDFFTDPSWQIRDRDHFLELHQRAVEVHRMFLTMPAVPGASEALWHLSDEGVHVRIITHRFTNKGGHARAAADTVEWLQRPLHDGRPMIPYRDICFIADKSQVDGHILVDDAAHNIEAWRAGRPGRKPGDAVVFDRGYNADVPGPRAHSWDDVVAFVEAKRSWLQSNPLRAA